MDPMHPADRTYRNQLVRLADLTVISDIITGITFEHCSIVGPAVIVLLGESSFMNSSVSGDAAAVLWDIGDRDRVIGAIGLMNCTIVGCQLERIGTVVPPGQREKFREGFQISD